MTETRSTRLALGLWTALVLLFLFVPIAIIVVYAFNSSNIQSWPIAGWTTHWFGSAWRNQEIRDAFWLSIRAGVIATGIALLLGTLASFAVHRFRFFGREAISFVVVLPIALPGIITGMAFNSLFVFAGINFSLWTIVIGHATFCIVIVYNNVIARLRRTQTSLVEASMDLGADGLQTFRHVTLPVVSTALVAGGLLAFALSFDEVIVTTFTSGSEQTLPIWMFGELFRPRNRPVTNVVAIVVMVVTLLPILLSQRLSQGDGDGNADMHGGGKSS